MYDFENVKRSFDVTEYQFSSAYKYIELFVFSAAGFFIPFFMGHPQIVVGILVNSFLISSSLKLRDYKILPVVLMPSLGALSRGLLFGPYTPFLLYMIPFIWLGNYLLVFAFRQFKLKKKLNYWITLVIGIFLKSGFLFIAAYALYSFGAVPAVFLTAMGVMQAATAFGGGVAAFGYEKISRILNKN